MAGLGVAAAAAATRPGSASGYELVASSGALSSRGLLSSFDSLPEVFLGYSGFTVALSCLLGFLLAWWCLGGPRMVRRRILAVLRSLEEVVVGGDPGLAYRRSSHSVGSQTSHSGALPDAAVRYVQVPAAPAPPTVVVQGPEQVVVSQHGERYHNSRDCGGLNAVTNRGRIRTLTRCSVCNP